MKFGLNMVPVRPEEMGPLAVRAEALGFESLWIGQHAATPVELSGSYPGGPRPPFAANSRFVDPFTALAYLGALTERVRLGTGILILPIHVPILLARQIATVDVLTGGRVSVGVGVGWMQDEFDLTGQSFHDRGARTDEMIQVLDVLFAADQPEFHGQHYQLPPMGFEPKPVQRPRPPLLIGGGSPAALRRAAVHGDGWFGTQGDPDVVGATVAQLRTLRAEFGRADAPFEVSALTGWGEGFDAGKVAAYAAAGVDRLVVTPWRSSRDAGSAIEQFARSAGLEA
jgi:probable F420-dependent oxidoreductase